ncbi:hypothetical protein C0Z17_07680 [Trinickia caryophylli]|nr:hypothetical protein C0Z17_07680 [Trinickia caryophylli]
MPARSQAPIQRALVDQFGPAAPALTQVPGHFFRIIFRRTAVDDPRQTFPYAQMHALIVDAPHNRVEILSQRPAPVANRGAAHAGAARAMRARPGGQPRVVRMTKRLNLP